MRRVVRPPARLPASLVLAALVAGLSTFAAPASIAAAASITFGQPSASSHFGQSVDFAQPIQAGGAIANTEMLVQYPGQSGPVVSPVDLPAATTGDVTLRDSLLISQGHLYPNTRLTARWRVTGADGTVTVGPPVSVRYSDTRFDWQSRTGSLVTVHWYEGDASFGRRALDIAERAIKETAQLLGVTEDEQTDFFVYADQDAFYDALGPGAHENVGGTEISEIRTLFALVTPSQINQDWVSTVIPHELVHLVFGTAVDNPYHSPPHWLNEGLAVYLSEGNAADYRHAVEDAVADRTIIPLQGLAGDFPSSRDGFFLGYGEGVSAVDYFVRTYGRDSLVSLIRSYARGLTDDEAFTAATGKDVGAFDAAWRAAVKAKEPVAYGPLQAPAGPLPPGWTQADGKPGATTVPGAVVPGASPRGGGAPGAQAGDDGATGLALWLVAMIVIGGGAAAAGLTLRRRGQRSEVIRAAAAAAPAVPPLFGAPARPEARVPPEASVPPEAWAPPRPERDPAAGDSPRTDGDPEHDGPGP